MTEHVALIDYGSGNLRSACKALERAAHERGADCAIAVTADPEQVRRADRVILPGVGAFAACMAGLDGLPGLRDALHEAVVDRGRPFLGICVGMQLLASRGLEHGVHDGLDWLPGDVVRLDPGDQARKVPHMGWNNLERVASHPVLDGLANGTDVYFVHSYHIRPADDAHLLAAVSYGEPIAAVVGRDNMVGTQFHPEKSQAAGLRLLGNFLGWSP